MSAHRPAPATSAFRHLDDRSVYDGHVWRVVVGTYQDPHGGTFERDVVRSPGAVAAVPVRDVGGVPTVVLVRQYRAALDEWVLEVPAGMRDVADEPIAVTASRELVEEAGYEAGSLDHLIDFYPSTGMTDSVLHLFLAGDLVPVERSGQGVEEQHLEVLEVPFEEALRMIDRGEIRDAKTVIGLLVADRRLRPH